MSLINSKVPEQRERGLALLERNEFSVPSPKELDSILSALTHHRTAGSVLVRQNVLRPLPALLHKCGSALRSSLDQVVPHLAERLADNDMGVRTLAARALLELLTVVRASVVVPAMLSKAVLGRSVRVREAVLLLLTHALHQRDPPPGMELPTACIKELPTILRLLDDAASLPAQAALALLQEVHATGIPIRRKSLAAAEGEYTHPPSPVRVGSTEEATRELRELARELRRPLRQDGAWQERAAAMRRVHGLLLGSAARLPTFGLLFHTHMVEPLSLQLTDLRSKCVKLACDVIAEGARVLGPSFRESAIDLMPALVRVLRVTVAVIADAADQCIRQLLHFVKSPAILPSILAGVSASDSGPPLRARCALYLEVILATFTAPGVDDYLADVEPMLTKALTDAGSEAPQRPDKAMTLPTGTGVVRPLSAVPTTALSASTAASRVLSVAEAAEEAAEEAEAASYAFAQGGYADEGGDSHEVDGHEDGREYREEYGEEDAAVGARTGEVGARTGEVGARTGEVGARTGEVGARTGGDEDAWERSLVRVREAESRVAALEAELGRSQASASQLQSKVRALAKRDVELRREAEATNAELATTRAKVSQLEARCQQLHAACVSGSNADANLKARERVLEHQRQSVAQREREAEAREAEVAQREAALEAAEAALEASRHEAHAAHVAAEVAAEVAVHMERLEQEHAEQLGRLEERSLERAARQAELARPEVERAASAQLMHARQLQVAEGARRAAEAEAAKREMLLKALRAKDAVGAHEDAVGAPLRYGIERGGGAPIASLALGDLPALPPAESSDDDTLLQPTGSDGAAPFGATAAAAAAGAPSSHVRDVGRPAAAGLHNMLPPRARLDGTSIMSTVPPGAPRSLASPPSPSHPLSTRGSAIGWAGAMPRTPPSPGMPEEAGDVVDLLAACNAYVDNIVAENQRMRSKLLSCRSRQSTSTGI
ncbi:clip-associating protein 1-like protein [Chrysochromulina tobinii]|uniref:Clip-associating protein 1-like protein n=1 Tax=Chrysochromulina tobinii TaxID=1460289 RepID=A0A0M0JTI0_9EUKA|nr:clip-associating protein 1-like protein [Chrysochromulina tobinii]|eukprot:KOO29951.1 clip-associating protein 1-like protein [Chrysochromulina sp. CCMP291]